MSVALVERAEGEKRLEALAPALADADEQPRREWNRELAGGLDGGEAHGGALVRRAPVWAAACGQPLGGALEHDAHRGGGGAQPHQLLPRHHPGIQVRKEPALAIHRARRGAEILEGTRVAELAERRTRLGVAQLRFVPEGEQRFLAPRRGTPAGGLE